jgi:transposase
LLLEAREIISSFQGMIRRKCAELDPWLERARASLVTSFANDVLKDNAAISTAIVSPWSNGQTEGQITKLKLVNAKCTAEENSTCSKPASSAPHRAASTKSASEPILHHARPHHQTIWSF